MVNVWTIFVTKFKTKKKRNIRKVCGSDYQEHIK